VKQTTDHQYRKALQVCSAKLSGVEGDNPQEAALCFFRMGVVLSKIGEICGAIRCFNDAFVLRDLSAEKIENHQLWREFHDTQMAMYILGKRNKVIASLAEGDMVHDLIKHRWIQLREEIENSEIPFAGKNKRLWFRTVKIDFPWEMEVLEEYDSSPFDRISDDILEECVIITR
jgi:hypothetical protein